MDWKERARELCGDALENSIAVADVRTEALAKAVRLMLYHWPEPPQDTCQKQCKADLLKRQNQSLKDRGYHLEAQVSNLQSHLDWRNDELKKARDYSGCPPDGDLVEHFGRLVTERDEFRRLHEEGQEALKECAKLRRSLHAVINEAKEALGVPEGESLVEGCKALAKEHNEYEQEIGEVFEAMEDRGLARAGTKLVDDVLRVIDERDALQAALDEQMAENGRLAALKDRYHWANGILAEELRKKEAQHERMIERIEVTEYPITDRPEAPLAVTARLEPANWHEVHGGVWERTEGAMRVRITHEGHGSLYYVEGEYRGSWEGIVAKESLNWAQVEGELWLKGRRG